MTEKDRQAIHATRFPDTFTITDKKNPRHPVRLMADYLSPAPSNNQSPIAKLEHAYKTLAAVQLADACYAHDDNDDHLAVTQALNDNAAAIFNKLEDLLELFSDDANPTPVLREIRDELMDANTLRRKAIDDQADMMRNLLDTVRLAVAGIARGSA